MIYFSDFGVAAPPATWQTMRDNLASAGSEDPGWQNFTLRLRYDAAGLTDLIGATKFRVTLKGGSAQGITLGKMYVGLEGGSNFDFNGSQVQALFSGSAGVNIPSGLSTQITDDINIAIDGTAAIVLSFFFANTGATTLRRLGISNSASGYKSGDDAATTVASGYTTTALLKDMPMLMEAFA